MRKPRSILRRINFLLSSPAFRCASDFRCAKPSEAELWAAKEKYLALAIEIRGQVRAAVGRLSAAAARAKLYRRQILPRRQRIVQETINRSNGMLAGVFDVLAARANELEARRREVEARRDYWLARIELERAAGGKMN